MEATEMSKEDEVELDKMRDQAFSNLKNNLKNFYDQKRLKGEFTTDDIANIAKIEEADDIAMIFHHNGYTAGWNAAMRQILHEENKK